MTEYDTPELHRDYDAEALIEAHHRAELAEAELAALKARRCDGCKWYKPDGPSMGACTNHDLDGESGGGTYELFDPIMADGCSHPGEHMELLVDADHACRAWTAAETPTEDAG